MNLVGIASHPAIVQLQLRPQCLHKPRSIEAIHGRGLLRSSRFTRPASREPGLSPRSMGCARDQRRHVCGRDWRGPSGRIGGLASRRLDFLGDAANYGISLFVVGMALRYRAMAALAKGGTMVFFRSMGDRDGPLARDAWHLPSALTMGAVGFAALAANAASFGLLWAYRGGDANMRSAWICTRNDVLGNLAVLLAAAGVFGTGTGWPDIVVAAIMAGLALQGAWIVVRQSLGELRQPLPISA